jgi:hypothetical protein
VNAKNLDALTAYCEVLLALRDMQDAAYRGRRQKSWKKKGGMLPKHSVINRMISHAIRNATDSAHPFGYSDTGKVAAVFISHDANEQLDRGDKKGLVCEHTIPVSELEDYIRDQWINWEDDLPNRIEMLSKCFIDYSVRTILTKKQDGWLDRDKLRKGMPPGKTIKDTFSRYEKIEIQCPPLNRTETEIWKNQKKILKQKSPKTDPA